MRTNIYSGLYWDFAGAAVLLQWAFRAKRRASLLLWRQRLHHAITYPQFFFQIPIQPSKCGSPPKPQAAMGLALLISGGFCAGGIGSQPLRGRGMPRHTLCFLSGTGYVQSTINVRDNQWHCISAVRQGGTINVYYDGNLVPAFTGLSASSLVVTYLVVGHGGATNALDWHGKVDDIKLWNIALSPAKFTACGACVLKCNEPGLVAYWQLDEAQANGNNVSFSQVSDCTGKWKLRHFFLH